MNGKKFRSKDEWKKLIHDSLTPKEFQDLCYDLIKLNGFKNVMPRGGGGDGGRDLEGDFTYEIAKKTEITEKCWFQCKRLSEGLNYSEILTEVQKAEDQNIKRFFILSISDTTPQCKGDIKNWNDKHKCTIIDWSGSKFLDVLFEQPNVCSEYFPDDEAPPLANVKEPGRIAELSSNLGERFGIEIKIDNTKNLNINNPGEVADALKEALLNKLQGVDINIKSLIYAKISMFFFALEKFDDAIMFLDKSLDITPRNVEALLNKGFILEKMDELKESNDCYDEILAMESKNKFALNNKAHNLRRMGDFVVAIGLVNDVLKIDPNFTVAVQNKIDILKALDKPEDAMKLLGEKEELFKKSINLQNTKVDLCIELLDLKEAYRINEEILAKDPDNIGAMNNKGVIYEKNSKFHEAEKRSKYLSMALACFEKVVDKNNKWPLGWTNKSVVFINCGDFQTAEGLIDAAGAMFPRDPQVLNKKGVVLLHKTPSNPRAALKYFDKALKLRVEDDFLLNKAQAQIKQRHWQDAIKTTDYVLKYNPKSAKAWGLKGEAYRRLHQQSKANTCFANAKKYERKPISLLE